MKLKYKKERGITLVALVVTVIILLILAAVSIAVLTGDNGILTKAKKAKDDTIEAQEIDTIKIAYTSALSMKNLDEKITHEDLQKELDNLNANARAYLKEEGEIGVKFEKTGRDYTIDDKGNIKRTNGEGGEIADSGNTGTYMTEEQVKELVNKGITEALNQNKEYITPTAVEGVTINARGYAKIGNLVIVNMGVSVDTAKLQLPTNINNPQTILTGLPIPTTQWEALYAYYYNSYGNSSNSAPVVASTGVYSTGELKISVNPQYGYSSSGGINIIGTYISK